MTPTEIFKELGVGEVQRSQTTTINRGDDLPLAPGIEFG